MAKVRLISPWRDTRSGRLRAERLHGFVALNPGQQLFLNLLVPLGQPLKLPFNVVAPLPEMLNLSFNVRALLTKLLNSSAV
jgi:hypothetical protein